MFASSTTSYINSLFGGFRYKYGFSGCRELVMFIVQKISHKYSSEFFFLYSVQMTFESIMFYF